MNRSECSKLALQFFSVKEHTLEYEVSAGNRLEFKTYQVYVAVFEDDTSQPPVIKRVRVRLTDDEYLQLLQWQLQNPCIGYNMCCAEHSDICALIEYQVEEKIFGDDKVKTYAIYLSEVLRDVAYIQFYLKYGNDLPRKK